MRNALLQGAWIRRMAYGIVVLLVVISAYFAGLAWYSRTLVGNAGLVDGKLKACPSSPNCVSSVASDPAHAIDAVPWNRPPEVAIAILREIIESMPKARIMEVNANYLHAELRSPTLGFADDIEFLAEPAAGRIDVRACARVGYSDMGANRRYVERIVGEFHKRAASGR